MKSKYLCIHSHFYQPPRENPWLEAIDYQDSAAPFHDWNQRIAFECYNPNGQSRILDDNGRVTRLTNNYARISFNFGATLLSWMEEHDPAAYQAILEGDRLSIERYNGHGNAIAQGFNHIIMPLANKRDKETQIAWGLYDFEKRFGRKAEAMWLPETAVDLESLEIMADYGMKYVILAPRQADAVRPIEGGDWLKVTSETVDTHQPYLIRLPNYKTIAAFFYEGNISQAVAFEGLLNNGENFANRLLGGFDARQGPQILHIATDGESYGHHHRHGDMALAYALDYIENLDKNRLTYLTNYGYYLEKFPPQEEALIHENSSWSCVHGIERWRNDCGCNGGMGHYWNQKWRPALREAVNMLRDAIAKPYEDFMSQYTEDPWAMRNGYIEVILDRSEETRRAFFAKYLKKGVDINEPKLEEQLLKAMELQRNVMLTSTSCAWFFDEISGTEAVQNLQYAARAIELAREIFDIDLEDDFAKILKKAPSNIPQFGDGEYVYESLAVPARVDFLKLGAHLAATALFMDKTRDGEFYSFNYEWKHFEKMYSGKSQMICAHVTLCSRVTLESQDIEFVVLHFGDHNINVGALPYSGDTSYKAMVEDFTQTFTRGDLTRSLRLIDKYFEGNLYSLNDFFSDQKKEIIDTVFSKTLEGVEDQFKNIYQQYYSVMRYLTDIHVALPPVFSHIARFVQSRDVEAELSKDNINVEDVQRFLKEARQYGVELDATRIGAKYHKALNRLFKRFSEDDSEIEALDQFAGLLQIRSEFPFEIDLSDSQSSFAVWVLNRRTQSLFHSDEWNASLEAAAAHLKIHI